MDMYVTVLGSGAALPIGTRRCSAQIVNIGGFKLLIDCAEGVQDRIRYNHQRLQSIGTIVISHLHGDHFFGLPGLLSTMHLCGRTEPVSITAPVGARQVIETIFSLTGNHLGFSIDWTELDFAEGEQRVLENRHCRVDAFPLRHSVPTYGYRITTIEQNGVRPKRYAYCCDTVYDEGLVPHVQGADLLCIECTFSNEYAPLAEKRLHLTAGQAGQLARMAGVGKLLLTHVSARYRDPEVLHRQAADEFADCVVAADNMRFELTHKGITITS